MIGLDDVLDEARNAVRDAEEKRDQAYAEWLRLDAAADEAMRRADDAHYALDDASEILDSYRASLKDVLSAIARTGAARKLGFLR